MPPQDGQPHERREREGHRETHQRSPDETGLRLDDRISGRHDDTDERPNDRRRGKEPEVGQSVASFPMTSESRLCDPSLAADAGMRPLARGLRAARPRRAAYRPDPGARLPAPSLARHARWADVPEGAVRACQVVRFWRVVACPDAGGRDPDPLPGLGRRLGSTSTFPTSPDSRKWRATASGRRPVMAS